MTETPDSNGTADLVPEQLQTDVPPAMPIRRRWFITDFLFYGLFPATRGPHLAARSIWRALAALLLTLIVLFGMIVILAGRWNHIVFMRLNQLDSLSQASWSQVRDFLANLIVITAKSTVHPSSFPSTQFVLELMSLILGICLIPFILGTSMIPFNAGGEGIWSVWKRSIKNTCWSFTLAIPFLAFAISAIHSSNGNYGYASTAPEWPLFSSINGAILVAILWLRALFVGTARYVGKPEGPGWTPRKPVCDDCGYTLAHLPLASRCPECGLPVTDSLPGGRRQPALWSRSDKTHNKITNLIRMQWKILIYRNSIKQIPILNQLSDARRFWWLTYFTTILTMMLAGFTYTVLFYDTTEILEKIKEGSRSGFLPHPLGFSFLMIPLPLLLMLVFNTLACFWGRFCHGIRDIRTSATVCFYLAPLLYPLCILTLTMFTTLDLWNKMHWVSLKTMLRDHTFLAISTAATIILLVLTLLACILRLFHAIRSARYANS